MFGLVQGEANAIAPGKTPLSSMSPTMVMRDGKPVMVTGSDGGPRIITVVLEAILNVIDHGMTIQEAIDAPRIHHQWMPDTVYDRAVRAVPGHAGAARVRAATASPRARSAAWPRVSWSARRGCRRRAGRNVQSLNLGVPMLPGATLFGAHDARGAMGAALGD